MIAVNPHADPASDAARAGLRLRRRAAQAGMGVACTLIVFKLAAYMLTDSVAVMTSLMDSTFDAVASMVTVMSVVHAAVPADEDHRFGHGKIEALSALGQALFIFGSAGYLFFESVHRFAQPQPVQAPLVGIGVMLFSIVLTTGLLAYQKSVIRRTRSVAIVADNLHYLGDLWMNASVLAAVFLSYKFDWPYFDPLFASLIAVVVLFNARVVGRQAFDILLDKELSDEERAKIVALVSAHPAVRGVHDLRTRHSGQQAFIEFHLELDGELKLSAAHDVTDELEGILFEAFPQAEVIIHQEPAGLNDHRLDNVIASR